MLVAGIGACFVVLFIAAYIIPDLWFDGNAYYIPTIGMWDSVGYVHWIDTSYMPELLNGYPKGVEVVTYVIKAFGDSHLLNTANLVFLPLGVLGIASIARTLGVSPALSLFAGAAFVLLPVNVNQATTLYVDPAFASCAVALLAMLLRLCQPGHVTWLTVTTLGASTALPLGAKSNCSRCGGGACQMKASTALPLGAKSNGIALCGIGMLGLVIVGLARSQGLRRRQAIAAGASCLAVLALVFSMSIVGGYWYLRNYVTTGTPLYPVGLSIAGWVVFPGMTVAQAISQEANTPPAIFSLPDGARVMYTWFQGLGRWPSTVLHDPDTRLGGLGFIWLVGCLPSIAGAAALVRRASYSLQHAFLLLLGVTSAVFLMTPMLWWARYTLWVYALGLPLCPGCGATGAAAAKQAAGTGLAAGLRVCLVSRRGPVCPQCCASGVPGSVAS